MGVPKIGTIARAKIALTCPIVGCEQDQTEHDSTTVSENIHRVTGPEIEGTMSVDLVMDDPSFPKWKLIVDTWDCRDNVSPTEGKAMADALNRMADKCNAMNAAIDGTIWEEAKK